MPIKLIPPRAGFSPYYYGRGSHLGTSVDRSTRCTRAPLAKRIIKAWEREIERDLLAPKPIMQTEIAPTFLAAVLTYRNSGRDDPNLVQLLAELQETPLDKINQTLVDATAAKLFPDASDATRNRCVYTPISAVLRHVGRVVLIKRPKGATGQRLSEWLEPEQAFALLDAADKIDPEFCTLCTLLLYTGCRLGEALGLTCDDVKLADGEAFVHKTKTGTPRRMFLPSAVVAALANHPRGLERGEQRVFRFSKSGRLYLLLVTAAARAEVTLPERQAFHLFRHTWATWMRRFAGADIDTLLSTRAWDSRGSAQRYMHSVLTEESRRAEMLPTRGRASRS